jgi:DNA-binding transcriptional LysR family regulator
MHIEDLHLTQIRLLAELLRLGSVSAASEKIGLSQPAASHALARLRKQFEDPLFTRTARGFEPTPFGERLATAAREAVDVLIAGIASNRSFDPMMTTRQFCLYLSDVGQTVFLPRLVTFLKEAAPGATVKSFPIPIQDPGSALSAGAVDLAIGFFTNLTTGFRQRFLFHETYVCVVRANHPKFRTGMTIEAFKATQHAIADATGMAHSAVEQFLHEHQLRRSDTVRVPTFHVLPSIVANSDLLAIIPSRLGEAVGSHMSVKVLPMPVPAPPWAIRMYWHERYHHDPPSVWLRKTFVELFSHDGAKRPSRSTRRR